MTNNNKIGEFVMSALEKKDSVAIYRHIPEVTAKAVFSHCENFRYSLTVQNRDLSAGKTVCVIMQNPSLANQDIADKSAQFLEKLIFQKEYKEFKNVAKIIIVNQFAFIQTNDFKCSDEAIGVDNDSHILKSIEASDIVLIAWGISNKYKKRQAHINSLIKQFPNKTLLQTKKHPSRGTYTDFLKPYNI